MKGVSVIDWSNKNVARKDMQDGPAVLCLVDDEGQIILGWDQNAGHLRTITYRPTDVGKLNPVIKYTLELNTFQVLVKEAYRQGQKDKEEETQKMLRGIFGLK